ncbi:MAG: heavy metal-associated domain-containing protein [Bacteroidota bacterium]
MKRVLILFFTLASQLVWAQQQPIEVAEGYSISIKTSAICEMCKETLERDMAFEKGVKSSDLDLDTKVFTVVYNPKKTDAETIRERITKVGYHADTKARDQEAYDNLPFCCKDGSHGTPVPQLPLKAEGSNK